MAKDFVHWLTTVILHGFFSCLGELIGTDSMKIVQRISIVANVLLLSACVLLVLRPAGSRGQPTDVSVSSKPAEEPGILEGTTADSSNPIEVFAMRAPFVTWPHTEMAYAVPPLAEVVALLRSKRATGQTDHFAFLVEYGLRVHQKYLKYTRLSRELPLEENMMLAELVRLAQFPPYTNAHEAGWLDEQFDNRFSGTGYSSYQIYIWAKEHYRDIVNDEQRYPNSNRILGVLDTIDKSARNGIGGGMVCHYGCVP